MVCPECSFGFVAMVLVLGWYDPGLCVRFLLAGTAHELGHLAALKILKVQVHSVFLGLRGAVIRTGLLDQRQLLLSAAAGPVANLVAGLCLLRIDPVFAVLNLGLCVCNLLPMEPLDGGRILQACLWRCGEVRSARILRICAFAVAGGLMVGACWLTVCLQAGVWPIFAALVLLWRAGETEK